jgi:phosphoesterase RecJ-like protein
MFVENTAMKKRFVAEFRNLKYIIDNADSILLVAHARPDADTVGANLALREYIQSLHKTVDIACFDSFPKALEPLFSAEFIDLDTLDLSRYSTIIACDSVDRGFDKVVDRISEDQVVVLIDHHPDIFLKGDVVIIDTDYSSSSELVYFFFKQHNIKITPAIAAMLLTGIIFDTGGFQHKSVSSDVMDVASDLVKKGGHPAIISQVLFSHNNISALKLWGKAFYKAKLNPGNGMIVTAVTQADIDECRASAEDIYQVASILSTVPDAKFSLVLSERPDNIIRASLRSISDHNVDVSAIAKQFGGGGHRLASGFEIMGKLMETEDGWVVV